MPTMADRAADERGRLSAVRRYDILDTPPDGAFDRITALAARFCQVPISTITIVDEDRIWFKSTHGIDVDAVGRDPGLCASAILQDTPYVVTNAIEDPRTLNNPLVRGELGLRFYVGVPLITSDGHRLGTLNVIDVEPRETMQGELATLTDLAAVVMDEMELRLEARRAVELEALRATAHLRESLLSGISHEMRTPISILNGLASLEPDDEFGDAEMRAMMRRHVRHLDWLVNQYLDFVALESGTNPTVAREYVDLATLVQEAVEVVGTGRRVHVEVDDASTVVLADVSRTRQVLLELLHNAVRFSPPDTPVTVEVRRIGDELVAASVVDRGAGIHPDDHDRVFDKNYRGPGSTGSGIGLYVARKLATAQDGCVQLESRLGRGSRFTLLLPVAR